MTGRADRTPGPGSAIVSDFLKLVSLASVRSLLVVAVVIALAVAVFFYVSLPVTQGRTAGELAPSELLSTAILGVDAAAFVLIVAAALHVGGEYSTGLIQSTLTLTPSRPRLVLAKFVTVGGAALLVGLLAAGLCVLAALVVGVSSGVDPAQIVDAAGMRLAVGSLAMPVLYAVVAASAAFVARGIAAGILVPLVLLVLGGLAGWLGDAVGSVVIPFTPVAAIHSLSGVAVGAEDIGLGAAGLSLLAWLGLSVGVAAWRLLRSDA